MNLILLVLRIMVLMFGCILILLILSIVFFFLFTVLFRQWLSLAHFVTGLSVNTAEVNLPLVLMFLIRMFVFNTIFIFVFSVIVLLLSLLLHFLFLKNLIISRDGNILKSLDFYPRLIDSKLM